MFVTNVRNHRLIFIADLLAAYIDDNSYSVLSHEEQTAMKWPGTLIEDESKILE